MPRKLDTRNCSCKRKSFLLTSVWMQQMSWTNQSLVFFLPWEKMENAKTKSTMCVLRWTLVWCIHKDIEDACVLTWSYHMGLCLKIVDCSSLTVVQLVSQDCEEYCLMLYTHWKQNNISSTRFHCLLSCEVTRRKKRTYENTWKFQDP